MGRAFAGKTLAFTDFPSNRGAGSWYASGMEYDDRWRRQQERMARYQERWARKQERWARKRERWAQRGPGHGIVGSVAVIALGVLFLLDNLGIVPFREVWRYWPVILIALGVVRLVDSHGTPSVIWGAMLAGIGGLLLLDNLQIIVFDWRLFWPAILIAIGILMLIRTTQFSEHWASVTGGGPAPPDSAVLNMWAMFSGSEQRVDAQNFRGGHISALFGGCEVDLRGAGMAEGQATIETNAMFGGVDIRVPATWLVEVRGTAMFGGFGDDTVPPRIEPGAPPPPRLILTGYAMFGGVSVSN